MGTYATRSVLLPSGKNAARVFLRRSQVIAQLVDDAGIKSKVEQPEWLDCDTISQYLETVISGMLSEGVTTAADYRKLERCDPVIFYCLLSLMTESDYAEGFRGLSAVNIIRGATTRPDLAREILVVNKPERDSSHKPTLDQTRAPESCLINAKAMRTFIQHCYSIAYENKVSASRFPIPNDETLDAICARISWTLDKCINSGRPGYLISNPFVTAADKGLPVFGYEMEEVYDEIEKTKKKLQSKFSKRVDTRPFYGVLL
jgi:hypothetical protein